jgi:hypothetical protein
MTNHLVVPWPVLQNLGASYWSAMVRLWLTHATKAGLDLETLLPPHPLYDLIMDQATNDDIIVGLNAGQPTT